MQCTFSRLIFLLLRLQFNRFIFPISARPQYAAQTFALLTTFPSKELTDSEQTIEKAGLTNAAIMQRLK